jgi:hypothetical protein
LIARPGVTPQPQLALQFITHNMFWEDKIRISSLYIHILEVAQRGGQKIVDENFLLWSSHCVISFKNEERGLDIVAIEGLSPERH